ncbi:MAG: FAD-dependent oxidoreductase [Parasphingorhabdus sp.]
MSDQSNLRVAIVGAGPAGFYSAIELLGNYDHDISVDMFDRLPTPWGLVRAGVAPDHAKTKSVTKLFQWCSARPQFSYFLNVEVGKDISHEELLSHYHAVIYAYGASSSRALGVAGEALSGSHAASEFVAWYNGHPDYAQHRFDLSGKRAVIVGNGNVALDIARILVKPVEELRTTDIADHAISALSKSNIQEVVILGRRGIADAACTSPELLALGDLKGVDVVIADEDISAARSFAAEKAGSPSRLNEFKSSLKLKIATEFSQRERVPGNKSIALKFLSSPKELNGDNKVEKVLVARNRLEQQENGSTKAIVTSETESLETGLVLSSIGYVGQPITGVPFDINNGIIPNCEGRAIHEGEPAFGTYCAGWIKRGPSGVIGTNKHCARETVRTIIADFEKAKLVNPGPREQLVKLLSDRNLARVDYDAWRRLDAHECELGHIQNRPRVKITSVEEMFAIAKPSTWFLG